MMRVLVSFLALTAVKETTAGEPATAGTRTSVQEDFAVVLTCRAGMEARIAAGRASRTGLRTTVVTDRSSRALHSGSIVNEMWLSHEGSHLEELASFLAFKALGSSFKWMFVGEDDTLFFRLGAATAVHGMDPEMPIYISDSTWFQDYKGRRHYAKVEAPRCVPCKYAGNLTALPYKMHRGCPCSVSSSPPEGFCGPRKEPSVQYSANGGPGYILSVGLLKLVPLKTMVTCLRQDESATLARCLWKLGFGATDPDPVWHPGGLTVFDPTPSPFLTHDSIMEKTAHALGLLLRAAAGACTGLCQTEMQHMVSLHVNAAKIGFTKEGEQGNGPFRDAGQREFIGQQMVQAISTFYSRYIISGVGDDDGAATDDQAYNNGNSADLLLHDALQTLRQASSFFKAKPREEAMHKSRPESLLINKTAERVRSSVATSLARQALNQIIDSHAHAP